jgi:hypothetical protein
MNDEVKYAITRLNEFGLVAMESQCQVGRIIGGTAGFINKGGFKLFDDAFQISIEEMGYKILIEPSVLLRFSSIELAVDEIIRRYEGKRNAHFSR